MIEVQRHGEITYVRLARPFFGRPIYWTGAYVVDGLAIDCGPPSLAREFLRAVAALPLSGLVITHHHEDHLGGAPLLQAERGLTPQLHAAGIPLARDGYPVEFYRRIAWGRPERVACAPLAAQVETRSLRFDVVHTPGHSPDHVCLFEPERGWLFTGDLFIAERLRFLRDDEDVETLVASLRRVSELPVREVFCAHRGPVAAGPAALRRKAEHLEALRGRIRDLLGAGLPEREVARRAVGAEGLMSWLSLGRFSALNFVRAVARRPQRQP